MSDCIKLLSELVANQIAAGEVVERPASVVKELLENAIDAGSSSITVNFGDGGKEFIQIVDNGCGMSVNDARLAFDRHATSKISNADDLYNLHTFGFRGEALPSIASVSEVELRTRQEQNELGTKVVINGGKFVSQDMIATSVGSMFIIRNLFYNIPGRRRHLKDARVETKHIIAEFTRVALVNVDVAFALYNNDVQVYNLPVTNLRQRIAGVIGKNISANLLELNVETTLCRIHGFVGRPASAKKKNGEQYLFVNGRYFSGGYFRSAILQAYSNLIPADMQPAYFIYFDVDPSKIDVNVHPKKTEIKFEDEQVLWQILNAGVRESLAKTGVMPLMDFDVDDDAIQIPVFTENQGYRPPETGANPNFNPFDAELDTGYNFSKKAESAGSDRFAAFDIGRREFYSPSSDLPAAAKELIKDEILSGIDFEYTDIETDTIDFINGNQYKEIDGQLEFTEHISSMSSQEPTAQDTMLDIESVDEFSDIMSVGSAYAAAVYKGNLLLVDIDRAMYRVRYDYYLKRLGGSSAISQQLLFTESVELSKSECTRLQDNMDELDAAGFDISFESDERVAIMGLPPELKGSPSEIIREMVDNLSDDVSLQENRRANMCRLLARMDTSSQSKNYSPEELKVLLEDLILCEDYSFSPDGHAILSSMTPSEIAKRLK
ncbi:MAG: DNA mismatch repair endonuclease MutL [Rikenellaceae bacterium]